MSIQQHNAIIVTAYFENEISQAWDKATKIGLPATDICTSSVNEYFTFVILTKGFKEGWDLDTHDKKQRKLFLDWAKTTKNRDGSGPLTIVQISYGERGTSIVSTTCEGGD